MNGKPRPTEFRTSPGSGHANETLKRTSQCAPTMSRAAPHPALQRRQLRIVPDLNSSNAPRSHGFRENGLR